MVGHIQTSYLPETTDEDLIQSVYHSLKGKRYLIVLDDMWSTDSWDELRMFFPDDNNGSRIIITTSLRNVAEYASSSPIHPMHFLDDDDSWNLLQEKVFAEESCPPELEELERSLPKTVASFHLQLLLLQEYSLRWP